LADLDTALLRAFVTVADEASFTRAALRLNRTQAAVSMQVRRLESALGVALFDDRKKVTLSEDGQTLIRYARKVLNTTDEAVARLGGGADVAGTVTLGTPDDYAASLIPPILARFARSHPRVMVSVRCEQSVDLVREVDAGRVDLALITQTPGLPGGPPLRREPLVWAIGDDDSVLEADPLPLALFPAGCLFRDLLGEALAAQGRSWRLAYVSRSLAAVTGAVAAGLAATVLAAGSVPPGLRVVGPDQGLPTLPAVDITSYHGARELSPATRCLRDYLAQSMSGPAAAA
jgi:DNA-binding transcriptional LysR family regulator